MQPKLKIKVVTFALLFLFGAGGVFSQDEAAQHRFIPEELLRPRRDEAPRYPVDTVIGPLGRGEASSEAYEFARNVAATLLAGTMEASVLSSMSKVFLENCMETIDEVNPRFFRLGSGREEPDGSVSFLIRFVGREQGISGELFIRFEELHPNPPPQELELEDESESNEQEDVAEVQPPLRQDPPANIPVERRWVFEDLILEEPRTRDAENQESRHRYDFPPYERFF